MLNIKNSVEYVAAIMIAIKLGFLFVDVVTKSLKHDIDKLHLKVKKLEKEKEKEEEEEKSENESENSSITSVSTLSSDDDVE